jgi:transposase-like protein
MSSRSKESGAGSKRPRPLAYPVKFRLRTVKLYLEEGYSRALLCEKFGISPHSLGRFASERVAAFHRNHRPTSLESAVLGRLVGRTSK